jgi:trk system potassium uptake protein
VRRAVVITSLALLLVALDLLILTVIERASFLQLLFEVTSAFATVGLSTGPTGSLTVVGKWVIAITMLVGRVGPLAIGFALLSRPHHARVRYTEDQLLIG